MDSAEELALFRLGDQECWGLDQLPAGVDADMLRCLDAEGLIEARSVSMIQGQGPGGPGTVGPMHHPWYSPMRQPELGGSWEAAFTRLARGEWEHPHEVRASDRGRAAMARLRRASSLLPSPGKGALPQVSIGGALDQDQVWQAAGAIRQPPSRWLDRKQEFLAAANTYPAFRCVLLCNDGSKFGPAPPLREWGSGPHGGQIRLRKGGSSRLVASRGGTVGWREALRRGVMVGPPPQEFVEGLAVDHPDSPFPKPWGLFDEGCADPESFHAWFVGSTEGDHRFRDLGAMTWREMVARPPPAPIAPIVEKLVRLVLADDDLKWLLLVHTAAWEGLTGPTVRADRMTWWGHLEFPLHPEHMEKYVEEMRKTMKGVIPDGPAPGKWRHFYCELEPALFAASAVTVDAILRAETLARSTGASGDNTKNSPVKAPLGRSEDAGTPSAVFRRDGVHWRVSFDGVEGSFPNHNGMRYIAALLARPNPQQAISALELSGSAAGLNEAAHTPQDRHDETARRQYHSRLEELAETLGQERGCYSPKEIADFEREQSEIVSELKGAEGLHGRIRRLGPGSPAEKARKAVLEARERAYRLLLRSEPPMTALVAHLQASVHTEGTGYAYRPGPSGPLWHL